NAVRARVDIRHRRAGKQKAGLLPLPCSRNDNCIGAGILRETGSTLDRKAHGQRSGAEIGQHHVNLRDMGGAITYGPLDGVNHDLLGSGAESTWVDVLKIAMALTVGPTVSDVRGRIR